MASFSKKICRAVEKRKILYDRTLQQRVKRGDIDDAWEAVAAECCESVHSVKTRWRNIRKVLLRFVSKTNTPPTRKTRSRDYYLYDELQFLLPHIAQFSQDELADSDQEVASNSSHNASQQKDATPASLKDHTDDSNECLSTLSANENGGATPVAGKRKMSGEFEKFMSSKMAESYVIAETSVDGGNSSSSMRFRRISNAKKEKVQQQPLESQREHDSKEQTNSTEDPLELNAQNGKRNANSKPLRTRSKSLYLERPNFDGSTDSDTDYNPPPRKKPATTAKVEAPVATSTIVTRKKAATRGRPPIKNKVSSVVATETESSVEAVDHPTAAPVTDNPTTEPVGNDTDDNEDFTGIDMTLLAAAAEAEAAAAAEEIVAANNALCPVVGADAAIQCDFPIDEEDDEFLQRMRKWLQLMTQRQKIIFRRGIYQAYMDVYDDPREFAQPKGVDKFQMSQVGVPAIFTGMTPVELRLVRHLAMAVTGHKITSSTSPYNNVNIKTSARSSMARDGASPDNNMGNNYASDSSNIKLPTLPTTAQRTPPEKATGNGNLSGGGILRTTAIALKNHHNGHSGAYMPRILRKVVRVGSGGSDSAGSNSSQNVLVQRGSTLGRPRLVTSGVNSTGDKQRVYRILSNGVVARQSLAPNANANANNNSNSSSGSANSTKFFGANIAMLNDSTQLFHSTQSQSQSQSSSGGGRPTNQYRQILPKLPTVSSASAASTSTSTSATLTTTPATITLDGETKLSGISIRRHVAAAAPATSSEGRTQMARRYSVCGSAVASNDHYSPTRKTDEATTPVIRRSVAGIPMVNIADQTKCTTRVRYALSPSQAVRTGALQPKFAMPSAVAGSQMNQTNNKSPNGGGTMTTTQSTNEPVPIAMNTWHTTQSSSQTLHELLQPISTEAEVITNQEDEQEEPNEPMNDTNTAMSVTEKQNCLITSDTFENFVIKNEPLDLENED